MSFVAYLDESSDPRRQRAFTLAGYVGHEDSWELFEDRWAKRLEDDGIQTFHMTDCENCYGEFGKWRQQKHKSVALITDLVSIVLESELIGFWSGVPLKDYNELVAGKIPAIIDDPYFLCFVHCLNQVLPGLDNQPPAETLSFVFEENRSVETGVLTMYQWAKILPTFSQDRKQRLGGATFVAKNNSHALQAADMIAYESFKHLDNSLFNPQIKERRSMARLKEKVVRAYPLHRDILEKLASEMRGLDGVLRSMFPDLYPTS